MNSFFGRININKNAINKALFNNSVNKLVVSSEVKKDVVIKEHVGFGQVKFSPIKKTETVHNLTIVSDSALYNKEELYKELKISDKSLSDEIIILKSFEVWGKNCVNHLIGDFSFAIWDSEKKELFCARDHLGVKPFNYYLDSEKIVFASDISSITEQSDLNLSIDQQYIADSISIIKSKHSQSTYNEIKKLPPAHHLTLKENKLEVKQYWELKPKEITTKNDEEIIKEFKSLLTEAVKCRIDNEDKVGAELSGGIDSSSITAIANQFAQIKTFSHVLPDHLLSKIYPFKDERKYINILTDYCGISESIFIKSESIGLIETLNKNVNDLSSISQQNFGVFSDHLYESAMQENVSVLLSGFGGDEVVTSKTMGYLSELAAQNRWNEIKDDLKKQKKSFFRYYIKFKFPILLKIFQLLRSEKPWWNSKFNNLAINEAFSKSLNIEKRFVSHYQNFKKSSLQEKNIERIIHPHVAQRLEYCSLITRRYGVEYRYPLLDIRLIEYYLAMPARLKARNGIGRYAIRKAIEGIVPKEIQWRNDKSGATIPTVFMRMMNDKGSILRIINQSKSNEIIKKYIDLDKYEQWFHKLCNRSDGKQKNINPGAFYNYLKLILFIKKNPNLFE